MNERDQALSDLGASLDSDFLKALSEPVRVGILKILIADGNLDVNGIADQLPQDRSVISRHLKVLKDAGLIAVEREGRHRVYRVLPEGFIGRLEQILDSTRAAVAVCCPPQA